MPISDNNDWEEYLNYRTNIGFGLRVKFLYVGLFCWFFKQNLLNFGNNKEYNYLKQGSYYKGLLHMNSVTRDGGRIEKKNFIHGKGFFVVAISDF